MQLDFIIDQMYLIAHTLSNMGPQAFSSSDMRADIVAFQDYAWSASSEYYNLFARPVSLEEMIVTSGSMHAYWQDFNWSGFDEFIATLTSSKEYKKVHEQTQGYLTFCKNQWEDNYQATAAVIHDLTGLRLHDTFTVYVTHPSQRNGKYYGDHRIGWGHHEDWPNYATVYLWHEVLHSYLGAGDLEHAVIQLVADEELRVRLNGGSYPPFMGHEYLKPLLERILPSWEKYLRQEQRDIRQFILDVK